MIWQWELFCLEPFTESTQLPWPPPGKFSTALLTLLIKCILASHVLSQNMCSSLSTVSFGASFSRPAACRAGAAADPAQWQNVKGGAAAEGAAPPHTLPPQVRTFARLSLSNPPCHVLMRQSQPPSHVVLLSIRVGTESM